MRKPLALGTLLALGLAGPALAADDLSYTFIEAAYTNSEIDTFDVDGDGFSVLGSLAFGERFFGFASFADTDYDFGIGAQTIELGAGLRWGLNDRWDLFGTASYIDVDVDVAGLGSASENGYGIGAGVRGRVTPKFELQGGIEYADLGDGADDTTFSAGGRYYFTEAFAAGLDVGNNDDGTSWAIVLRYDFGG